MQKTFIDPDYIEKLLSNNTKPDKVKVFDVLNKASECKGLSPEDVAVLLGTTDKELWEEIFSLAKTIKQNIYGNRIVLFAPLYVSNYCYNDCKYCGFRMSNKEIDRCALSIDDIRNEVTALEEVGHKRLLMVFGEHPHYGLNYMYDSIIAAYDTKTPDGKGEIRRINVNAAPMTVEEYKRLKETGIGTFQVFQETYHPGRYAELHPSYTQKGDYAWRLYALHRAQEGGLDDVAVGALLGLYDWKFEIISILMHALDMEKHFGVGPHTVSFPRLEPAINTPFTTSSPYLVSDEDFKKAVAIIRLMVPYTGMILTARETPEVRKDVINLGCSQIDAGTKIGVGSYSEHKDEQALAKQQFTIFDTRSLDEVIRELLEHGFLPSFCTSCYRLGRTGNNFMNFAKEGEIKH